MTTPPHSNTDAVVIGAGVIGLTAAIRLAEGGIATHVMAAGDGASTTSFAAGASWGPHLVAEAPEVDVWSRATLAVHRALAAVGGSGVTIGTGVEASRGKVEVPPWAAELGEIRLVGANELPDGYATGWHHRTPLLDMPVHLAYLRERARGAGVTFEMRTVATLDDVTDMAPIVVNATGAGAAALVGDEDLRPVRGQVVVVANPGITEFFVSADDGDLTYFFPHAGTVVLGGQADDGNWSTAPDDVLTADIIGRCAAIDPRLANAAVLGVRVGLRPYRPRVRVEAERRGATTIIHDYGHGGSGVTLSWGCADEVLTLARATQE